MKIEKIMLTVSILSSFTMAKSITIEAEGINYIKMLGGQLKSELQAKMKADPTAISAAKFCRDNAQALTKEVNSKLPKYATVKRTSMKLRNSKNVANDIDIEVMNSYIKDIESKKYDPTKAIKVVERDSITRVYKPLFVQKVCLKCHGSNISPEISKLIKDKYPEDKAIGLNEGDFRGVMVAEIKKDR